MNYKYKIEEKEYVLSQEEHEKIGNALNKGGGVVVLRGGDLLVNTSFIRRANKTEDMTLEQLERKDREMVENANKYSQLSDGVSGVEMILASGRPSEQREKNLSYTESTHFSFYEKMGWNHDKKDCLCKKEGVGVTK